MTISIKKTGFFTGITCQILKKRVILMKEVKHYICEICGTEYNEKMKAQRCEKNHCKPVEIVKCRYLCIQDNKKGYPLEITVKMADGTEQKYKR